MEARSTTRSAYRCDTDLLIREILEAEQALWARTARWPCTVLVHPLDRQALTMAPIGQFGLVTSICHDGSMRLRNMAMFDDQTLSPGLARVETCDGCMSWWPATKPCTRRAPEPRANPSRTRLP